MSARNDPPRWLSDPPADLREPLARGASEYLARVPHASQRDRMWSHVERELHGGVVKQGVGWSSVWIGIGAAVLVGVGAAAFVGLKRHEVPALPPSAAKVPAVASAPQIAEAARPPPPVAPAAIPSPPRSNARERVQRSGEARALKHAPTAESTASELELLVRARRLVRSAPERALQLAEQHRIAFPRGMLAEERELLAIESLRRMGQHEFAQQRASSFRTTFPKSAHLRRIDSLSGRE